MWDLGRSDCEVEMKIICLLLLRNSTVMKTREKYTHAHTVQVTILAIVTTH